MSIRLFVEFEFSKNYHQSFLRVTSLIYWLNLWNQESVEGIWCHIINIFMGELPYAHDITILSPSTRGLNEMLHICSTYADIFDITFNSKKKRVYKIWRTEMSIRDS